MLHEEILGARLIRNAKTQADMDDADRKLLIERSVAFVSSEEFVEVRQLHARRVVDDVDRLDVVGDVPDAVFD